MFNCKEVGRVLETISSSVSKCFFFFFFLQWNPLVKKNLRQDPNMWKRQKLWVAVGWSSGQPGLRLPGVASLRTMDTDSLPVG